MNDVRYNELMADENLKLTKDEIICGWHFCPDWDGLLIGPGMEELKQCCVCGGNQNERSEIPKY